MSRFETRGSLVVCQVTVALEVRTGRHTHGRRRLGMDCLEDRTLLSQPGTWAAVAPLPTTRVYLGSPTLDGIIYAVGGDTGGGGDPRTSEVDAYNPQSNQWTQVAPLPEPTMSLAAVADNGLMYAIGSKIVTPRFTTRSSPTTPKPTVGPKLLRCRLPAPIWEQRSLPPASSMRWAVIRIPSTLVILVPRNQ